MQKNRYYFSTRDLLMMAALAALGGVTGTYISAAGRVVQSLVGGAGTMQWAAGLHVLWLTLAVSLTGKQGAGTVTGLLKGAVELLTGNPHGLLVVLVDIVAGLLVDLGFLPFRDKDRWPGYLLAGGLASASNVFVFQLFASLPADILSYGALLLAGLMATLSGVVFAGFLAYLLQGALRSAGVIKDRPPQPMGRRAYPIFIACAILLSGAFTLHLRQALSSPAAIPINGAVVAPYEFPTMHGDLPTITAEVNQQGATVRYTGVPLRELVQAAQPHAGAGLVLIEATDGYAFFVGMDEIMTNASLLLASQGSGDSVSYNIVGAESSKAWVRGVSRLTVIRQTTLEITGALAAPAPFNPLDWQLQMDSINLDLGEGARKVQGAPLGAILTAQQPTAEATTINLHTADGLVSLPLADVLADSDVRLFTVVGEESLSFAVARMDGTVIAPHVTAIEVH